MGANASPASFVASRGIALVALTTNWESPVTSAVILCADFSQSAQTMSRQGCDVQTMSRQNYGVSEVLMIRFSDMSLLKIHDMCQKACGALACEYQINAIRNVVMFTKFGVEYGGANMNFLNDEDSSEEFKVTSLVSTLGEGEIRDSGMFLITCERCSGTGEYENGLPCFDCLGRGKTLPVFEFNGQTVLAKLEGGPDEGRVIKVPPIRRSIKVGKHLYRVERMDGLHWVFKLVV